MDGYDTGLISSFYGLPAFQKQYGDYAANTNSYVVPAGWQVALSQATSIGSFFGIFWGSFLVDRLGYRLAIIVNLSLLVPFIGESDAVVVLTAAAVTTFAPNRVVLLVGELLCALPWGTFSTLADAYASDICPLTLRAYLTTYVNLCWVIGHLISSGVLVGVQGITTEWGYRIPFALQWIWPVPLIAILYFAPESPWWLVRKGRYDEAKTALRRTGGTRMSVMADETVANMIRTNQLEIEAARGDTTSYIDCFKGTNRRRTEISAMAWACQRLCGSELAFLGYH